MSKPTQVRSAPFSLPVLLSFNELAWVAIFAMGLIAAYTVQQLNSREKEHAAEIIKSKELLERDRLLSEALSNSKAETAAAHLEKEKANAELKTLGDSLNLTKAQRQELEKLAKANDAEKRELARQLGQTRESVKDREALVVRLEKATEQSNELNRQLTVALEQSSIRKELLGLRGPMKTVAFIVDRSGSMTPRWQETVNIIETWFKFLPVENCVVIAFSNDCIAFPGVGFNSLVGPQSAASREYFIRELRNLKPDGATNTPAALKLAYSYRPDTIILFTDGKPLLQDVSTSRLMKDCVALVSKPENRAIPINCVGVGEYYKETDLIEFLINLSKMTGGSFLGRYN